MSKTIVPEWLRLKREIESLVRGVWHEIMRHDDWLGKLDKRVEKLEEDKNKHIYPEC